MPLNIIEKVKRLWKRYFLRDVRYRNDFGKLESLYLLEDPWQMDSPGEQFRFEQTNELIARQFGRVGSILEIGCGEAHQSLWLAQTCGQLTGVDVSARAIARAQRRCPAATFLVGDIFSGGVEFNKTF